MLFPFFFFLDLKARSTTLFFSDFPFCHSFDEVNGLNPFISLILVALLPFLFCIFFFSFFLLRCCLSQQVEEWRQNSISVANGCTGLKRKVTVSDMLCVVEFFQLYLMVCLWILLLIFFFYLLRVDFFFVLFAMYLKFVEKKVAANVKCTHKLVPLSAILSLVFVCWLFYSFSATTAFSIHRQQQRTQKIKRTQRKMTPIAQQQQRQRRK